MLPIHIIWWIFAHWSVRIPCPCSCRLGTQPAFCIRHCALLAAGWFLQCPTCSVSISWGDHCLTKDRASATDHRMHIVDYAWMTCEITGVTYSVWVTQRQWVPCKTWPAAWLSPLSLALMNHGDFRKSVSLREPSTGGREYLHQSSLLYSLCL